MNAALLAAAPVVAIVGGAVAVAIVATRPGARRFAWSVIIAMGRNTPAWPGTSDDAFTPAGWNLNPSEDDEWAANELEAVAAALRDCGDEVRSGCTCDGCEYIRDVLVAIYGWVSDSDRDLLAGYGIAWDRTVAS